MLVFGITGGSGTGKTTVSDIFRSLGVYVSDADKTAHEVTAAGTECLAEIAEHFGNGVLNADKTLNRKKLGAVVFSDGAELEKLNGITHKYIKDETEKSIAKNADGIAAIDGAVIIGSNMEGMCRFIVSVISERNTRLRRIMQRDGISAENAEKRLSSQPPDEFYIKNSKYVIYNNGGIDELRKQTEDVLKKIKEFEL